MPLQDSDYDQRFVAVSPETTIGEALMKLADLGGQDDWHFFIIQSQNSIGAVKVGALRQELELLGGALFDLTFSQLVPNPPGARVGQQNAIGIGTAEAWAVANESGVLAVMKEGHIVGRLSRSGQRGFSEAFPASNMGTLYGEYIDTRVDARSRWQPGGATPPTCPNCGHQGFFGYDVVQKHCYCRNCNHAIPKGR